MHDANQPEPVMYEPTAMVEGCAAIPEVPWGRAWRTCLALLLVLASAGMARAGGDHPAHAAPPGTAAVPAAERPFLAENEAAMARMMDGMAVRPSGDIDRDFVVLMTAHHQGAIDMALALLRYGGNEQLRRLAQEIIVTQQQEIVAMHLAIGAPLPPSAPAPTQAPPHSARAAPSDRRGSLP